MSASSVIADVTDTLEELLKSEQRPKGSFSVSLKSPAEETVEPSMKPKVNLFLFRVIENAFAKNEPWQAEGTNRLLYPPLALNLFYVLTPFADNKLDEHRVLGEAMRVLHDHPIIQTPLLKGSLEFSTVELKVGLCQVDLEDLTRIWNALSKPYRLSVYYEVRMVLIDSSIEREVQRVTEKEDRFS